MAKKVKLYPSWKGCLKHLAFKEEDSIGRKYPEKQSAAGLFLTDLIRISTSRISKRLRDISQVASFSDYTLSNRQNHTLCVVTYSDYVCDFLRLNGELTRAIALSHDIGQPPFAHSGESFLSKKLEDKGGDKFAHECFGVIVVSDIAELNLTFEVLQGIHGHSGKGNGPSELSREARVVRIVDNIANLFEDIENLSRSSCEIASEAKWFGQNLIDQITNTLNAFILESIACKEVSFEQSEYAKRFYLLRDLAYKELYPKVDNREKIPIILDKCFGVLESNKLFSGCDLVGILSIMSETDIINLIELSSNGKISKNDLTRFPFGFYLPRLRKMGQIKSFSDPDFSWINDRKKLNLKL